MILNLYFSKSNIFENNDIILIFFKNLFILFIQTKNIYIIYTSTFNSILFIYIIQWVKQYHYPQNILSS